MNDHQMDRCVSGPDFDAWVQGATPGSTFEYHRGSLAVDADQELSTLPEPDRQRLRNLRDQVYGAAAADKVDLVQRRIGPDNLSYMAILRRRRHVPSGDQCDSGSCHTTARSASAQRSEEARR